MGIRQDLRESYDSHYKLILVLHLLSRKLLLGSLRLLSGVDLQLDACCYSKFLIVHKSDCVFRSKVVLDMLYLSHLLCEYNKLPYFTTGFIV